MKGLAVKRHALSAFDNAPGVHDVDPIGIASHNP
jgi:hypothetical protein